MRTRDSKKQITIALLLALSGWLPGASADESKGDPFAGLAGEYLQRTRPLIERFCLDCHSTKKQKGDLDLERFTALADVRRGTEVWIKVVEMLDIGEMPPEDSDQLLADERKTLRGWVERYLREEAFASAGDPGRVVLRRLNNAEYTYTIRDLTGVDLDPAREFPNAGAAGEGFTNVGDALVMSPAMMAKYLDAGKDVASHAVLLPDSFRFSPHTTRRDWTDEIMARIREFYGEFSESNDTGYGRGGSLPLEKYFAATIVERESLATGAKTPAVVAAERGLHGRYLRSLWSNLTASNRSLLLDSLRRRWRAANPEDAAVLADDVASWQKGLWVFNPVGLIGKKGSRSQWLEPVDPLLLEQTLRFEIPASGDGEQKGEASEKDATEVVVSLVVTDAGDGNAHDFVVWQRPRLVAEKQRDILLRDLDGVGGVDRERFGKHPNGRAIDPASLCVRAPSVITIRLPAEIAAGRTLVTTATLHPETSRVGSAQVELVAGTAERQSGLQPGEIVVKLKDVDIGADTRTVSFSRPILVGETGMARKRFELAMNEYRDVFPAALCYTQIVPVDESLTLTLFYREDDQLVRVILDDTQKAKIDRLWRELIHVSREPFRLVDVLDSLLETTIGHPQAGVFNDAVVPFNKRADAFRKELAAAEPRHVNGLVAFAARAYRRPLTGEETSELRGLYRRLREQELSHDEAFRLALARVLAASPFLYRLEEPPATTIPGSISDLELATRLSYFLWSSMPDAELRAAAEAGRLTGEQADDELRRQTRRMLDHPRVRRLAIEFACQWLHIHDFDAVARKSEKVFPEFPDLRGDMYEESILFLTGLFRENGSLLRLLDADHTFVNDRLAEFYGVPGVQGSAWRRLEGIRQHGRGGILGFSTTLAAHSGASRTSPILRGNWVSEVLLGEKLPRPPKNVPQLADEIPENSTERQLIEQHSSDPACAKCHDRIDPFGFALERFDAIGRRRDRDVTDRPIDTRTTLPDGTEIDGLTGLRAYLLEKRRDAFLRQFCRKLLGYALGREVQLSDTPLLTQMLERLDGNDHRFTVAVETIVLSDQFRKIRGKDSGEPERRGP